jgi:hypothetical protein
MAPWRRTLLPRNVLKETDAALVWLDGPPPPPVLHRIFEEMSNVVRCDVGQHARPTTLAQPPNLITSLLLAAAGCHLRLASTAAVDTTAATAANNSQMIAVYDALYLACTAIALQPQCARGYQRAAAALARMPDADDHVHELCACALLRHAALLEGRPPHELIAQLPPLPPAILSAATRLQMSGALKHVCAVLNTWPELMAHLAPPDLQTPPLLLQLPGGMAALPPGLLWCDVNNRKPDMATHVEAGYEAKAAGDAKFVAGDVRGALASYLAALQPLRFTASVQLRATIHVA